MDRDIALSDIAQINPPRRPISLNDLDIVSFIPMSDVTDNARWISRQTRFLKEVKQGYTYFEEGDILFAKITPCTENGKGCLAVGLKNGIGFGSTEFHVLRAKPNGDAGFIFQWTISKELRQQAAARMTGSAGQQRVPVDFLENLRIPDLPQSSQSKIAEVLSTVDRAIERTEALIAKYRRIKTGLMQDLLTRGIDEHGQIRNPAIHQFKDSPVGRIPKEWRVEPFGDHVESSAFGPRFPATAYSENGRLAMIRTTDLDDEGNIISKTLPLVDLNPNGFRNHLLKPGDLLITRSGTIGIACVFETFEWPVIPGAFTIRFRLKKSVLSKYYRYFFNSSLGRRLIHNSAAGGVQKNLTGSSVLQLMILVPPFDEQKEITTVLDLQFESCLKEQNRLDKLQRLKAGLMQDLLTGRVSVEPLLRGEDQCSALSRKF